MILLLAAPCLSAGPKYRFDEPLLNDEFENAYKDIETLLKGNVRIDSSTFASITVSTITVTSSATIRNLSVSTITYQGFTLITPWQQYTPAFTSGFGVVTDTQVYWRQSMDTVEIHGAFKDGTVAGTEANFSIPAGKTIDFTKCPASIANICLVGIWYGLQTGGLIANTAFGPLFADGSNNGRIFFALNATAGSGLTKANANGLTGNNTYVLIDLKVPVSN